MTGTVHHHAQPGPCGAKIGPEPLTGDSRPAPAVQIAIAMAEPFEFESFALYAEAELRAVPLSPRGVCGWPDCSARFQRGAMFWKKYCCAACRRRDEAEMRRIGQKLAPALSAYQAHRYAKKGTAEYALSLAGLRYVRLLGAHWLKHRKARVIAAGGQA